MEYTELQEYADALVVRYINLLNLQDWDIKIKVQDEVSYAKKHGKSFAQVTNGCADIFQKKNKARIYIKDCLDEGTFKNCIIHEIVHIPLNEMYVVGLTAFKEIDNPDIQLELMMNWEWQLEAAVCRLTHALNILEHGEAVTYAEVS